MQYDYEKFHDKYSADIHDDPARHSFVAGLCRGLVFDVGCGTGTLADYYLGDYSGCDISCAAIRKAQEIRRHSALFHVCDAASDPDIHFGGVDTIVMCEFLEHIENDDQLFARIKETAKPGARLVISVPNDHAMDCDEHVRYFTIPELRKKFEPLGRVKFYNWSGVRSQIVLSVDLAEQNSQDLSLVMIVKDEEKGLENAILSAIEYVDEVCILVDSSTTDKTLNIVKKYADNFNLAIFADDFAHFRNIADELAHCQWRLFLDGHEVIERWSISHDDRRKFHNAYLVNIKMEDGMQFTSVRFYEKGCKFDGAVHEKIIAKNVVYLPDFVIKHDREQSQNVVAAEARRKQRDDMVPRIMGARVKKDPTDTRALFHLCMWAVGTKKYRLAAKYGKLYLKYSISSSERWFVLFNMSLCHLFQRHYFRADLYAHMANDEDPDRWEIQKLLGMIYYDKKRWDVAVEYFIMSLKPNSKPSCYVPWIFDTSATWNIVGECYYNLNQFEKSAQAFHAASEQVKDPTLKNIYSARSSLMEKIAVQQFRGFGTYSTP